MTGPGFKSQWGLDSGHTYERPSGRDYQLLVILHQLVWMTGAYWFILKKKDCVLIKFYKAVLKVPYVNIYLRIKNSKQTTWTIFDVHDIFVLLWDIHGKRLTIIFTAHRLFTPSATLKYQLTGNREVCHKTLVPQHHDNALIKCLHLGRCQKFINKCCTYLTSLHISANEKSQHWQIQLTQCHFPYLSIYANMT